MPSLITKFFLLPLFFFFATFGVSGQDFQRELKLPSGGSIEIRNRFGRISATTEAKPAAEEASTDKPTSQPVILVAKSEKGVSGTELKIDATDAKIIVDVVPSDTLKRIDLVLTIPERVRLKIETLDGAVEVTGNLEIIDITTDTGTVAADVPTENLSYEFLWTSSRPRYLADFELAKVKEKSAGRFLIKGSPPKDAKKDKKAVLADTINGAPEPSPSFDGSKTRPDGQRPKAKDQNPNAVLLNFTTARGIILLNVPPNEVSPDLRERPLTWAAKAIIRSGDSLLMDAIRRASPKYFGEYSRTLPPAKREPFITEKTSGFSVPGAEVKTVLVNVFDTNNRSIADLAANDFEIAENGDNREVMSVRPVTAPFNLVLLLDVSGSVEDYVTFIRKAARSFVDTMGPDDRITIVTFNDDVKVLSKFTTDKASLSASVDSFDAGGGTAYYDAIAYTLADTLRPLRGDRSAIVVLTDGDDNRSFLPFDSLLGTIQESGALIYPLYVPSGLIAASLSRDPNSSVDTLRMKYMGLTSKAEGEGEKLAQVSGGVYYPISQLSQIQTAYDDIAKQLRTAYSVTFRSQIYEINGKHVAPRLRIKVKRENTFVKIGSTVKSGEPN